MPNRTLPGWTRRKSRTGFPVIGEEPGGDLGLFEDSVGGKSADRAGRGIATGDLTRAQSPRSHPPEKRARERLERGRQDRIGADGLDAGRVRRHVPRRPERDGHGRDTVAAMAATSAAWAGWR